MATNTLIPVSEYLRSSYDPDRDYVDGEVQERNLGETEHSDLQSQLLELLRAPENKQYVRATTEARVQVKEDRFRVPDVCVRRISTPTERFIVHPPLLCIEVLSPEDRMCRIGERVADYLEMGVPEVWVFNLLTRSVTTITKTGTVEQREGNLCVPDTPVRIALADVFRALDEY